MKRGRLGREAAESSGTNESVSLRQRLRYTETYSERVVDESDEISGECAAVGAPSGRGSASSAPFTTINRSNIGAARGFFRPISEMAALAENNAMSGGVALASATAAVAIPAPTPTITAAVAAAAMAAVAVGATPDMPLSITPVLAPAGTPVASTIVTPVSAARVVAVVTPRRERSLSVPDAPIHPRSGYSSDSPSSGSYVEPVISEGLRHIISFSVAAAGSVVLEHAGGGGAHSPRSRASFDSLEELGESLKGMEVSSSKYHHYR